MKFEKQTHEIMKINVLFKHITYNKENLEIVQIFSTQCN